MPADRPRIRVMDWIVGSALGGALLLIGGKQQEQARLHSGRGQARVPASKPALSAGHEIVDADARRIGQVLAGLAVTVLVSVAAMGLMLDWFAHRHAANRPALTVQQQQTVQPPLPHLQIRAYADLHTVQTHEDAILHGYGWRDADHTRAKIPIDRAMALMVGRTLAPLP